MTGKLVLGIDQGGSGSRAVILDQDGRVRGYGHQRVERIYPRPGWVEQDPTAISQSVRRAINEAMKRAFCRPSDLVACGITSQRDTVFAWDAPTGRQIGNAITWQDLRTTGIVTEMNRSPLADLRRERLGQFPGAYCSAMHMAWRMRHDPAFRTAAESGRLRVSLAAGWLVRALGIPEGHSLDVSLLQGMTVFDPRRRSYWEEWLDYLRLPRAALPAPSPTNAHFGALRLGSERHSVPVTAMIADQQAALFGYDCRLPGQSAVIHGTASFINVVVGDVAPPQRICKMYRAWELHDRPTFTLEADLSVTGAAVRWLAQIGIVRRTRELGALAASVPDSGGMLFVPAFTGLGVPSEDRSARGTMVGMTLGTSRGHIARAFFESIGYQLREAIEQVETESGLKIGALRVGGGLASSNEGCQIQADTLGRPLVRARDTETGVRAAAILAGLGAGYWQKPDDLAPILDGGEQVFDPRTTTEQRDEGFAHWKRALERAQNWERS